MKIIADKTPKQEFMEDGVIDSLQLASVRIGAEHGECIVRSETRNDFYICTYTIYGPSEVKIPCSNWKEVYDFMRNRHCKTPATVSNISWETDGEKVELPSSVTLMVDRKGDMNYDICEQLSEKYGYLVLGYRVDFGGNNE